ncbi:MAG: 50S ribosomal protein L18 [Patescibacteria group bacterium]
MSTKVNHHMTRVQKRKLRVRAKLHGTALRPRVSVFRSSEHTSLQVINDETGTTLVTATEKEVKEKGNKSGRAVAVAKILAEKMKKVKVTTVVFDRGSYRYHGRVKAIADTLREAGIQV